MLGCEDSLIATRARRLLILCAALVAGCGAAAHRSTTTTTHLVTSPPITVPNRPPLRIPDPPPTGIPAPVAAVAVIRDWANALRRGDVSAAARYFALPSKMINGSGAGALVLDIHTTAEAVAAQETLPCGARLISTDRRGRYVNALFALTGRSGPGGGNCGGGSGSTARTNFVISRGRIVEWIRAPSEPGDQGASPPSSSGPSATV
jgi:hypothetical protein